MLAGRIRSRGPWESGSQYIQLKHVRGTKNLGFNPRTTLAHSIWELGSDSSLQNCSSYWRSCTCLGGCISANRAGRLANNGDRTPVYRGCDPVVAFFLFTYIHYTTARPILETLRDHVDFSMLSSIEVFRSA